MAEKEASTWKIFIQRWVINTLAVLVAVYLVSGIDYRNLMDLLVASLLLGILNAFLRPILMLLSLPLLVVTLGFFTLIINAFLLLLVSWMLSPHFVVKGFGSAFWGALIISIVSLFLNIVTGAGNTKVEVRKGQSPNDKGPPPGDGGGPVIDV